MSDYIKKIPVDGYTVVVYGICYSEFPSRNNVTLECGPFTLRLQKSAERKAIIAALQEADATLDAAAEESA